MRKFKHRLTNNIAVESTSEKNYKVSEPRNFTVPKWIIENSNDWEEITEYPKLNIGVWYKVYYSNEETFHYFKSINNNTGESISPTWKGHKYFSKNVWYTNFKSVEILKDLNEIQEYLPENHIDKIKKDYEILSFCSNDFNNRILKNEYGGGFLDLVSCNTYSEKHCLEWKYKIHSVKRLFDGEIFTVGDKIDSTMSDLGRATSLTNIKLENNKLLFGLRDLGYYPLNTLLKCKKPLFITEDGVEIFENTKFWYVNTKLFDVFSANSDREYCFQPSRHKLFSTKELAEKYIKNNKLQYSLEDIVKCLAAFDKEVNNYEDADYLNLAKKYVDKLESKNG